VSETTIEALIQLGFAGAIGTWLVYWLTTTFKKSLDANTSAVLGVQLMQAEVFKLLIQHDAQIRGVNPSAGVDATDAHEIAAKVYGQVLERVELLEETIREAMKKVGQ
jgi:hypothetical protein